jgi:hypothetical protein
MVEAQCSQGGWGLNSKSEPGEIFEAGLCGVHHPFGRLQF